MNLRDKAQRLRELADELDALADEQGEPREETSEEKDERNQMESLALAVCRLIDISPGHSGTSIDRQYGPGTIRDLRTQGYLFTRSVKGVSGDQAHLTDKGKELVANNKYS